MDDVAAYLLSQSDRWIRETLPKEEAKAQRTWRQGRGTGKDGGTVKAEWEAEAVKTSERLIKVGAPSALLPFPPPLSFPALPLALSLPLCTLLDFPPHMDPACAIVSSCVAFATRLHHKRGESHGRRLYSASSCCASLSPCLSKLHIALSPSVARGRGRAAQLRDA